MPYSSNSIEPDAIFSYFVVPNKYINFTKSIDCHNAHNAQVIEFVRYLNSKLCMHVKEKRTTFLTGTPLLKVLHSLGLEADQKFYTALSLAGGLAGGEPINDGHLFTALYRQNTIATRQLELQIENSDLNYLNKTDLTANYTVDPETVTFRYTAANEEKLLHDAIKLALPGKTFGCRHFLNALLTSCIEYDNDWFFRPHTSNIIARHFRVSHRIPIGESLLREMLNAVKENDCKEEDFQYIIGFANNTIYFRVTSILGDYIQLGHNDKLVPQRALLTHFTDCFGAYTTDEISELEQLINTSSATEQQFQEFFDTHPHFFRKWDYREVYSQVVLKGEDELLIPDFILTDRDLQKAAVLDLKLPRPRLIRRQKNRNRFAAAVTEARAQLHTYRDWFRSKSNRRQLCKTVGMEVYEPHLIVVIGRSSEFMDEFDRQRLAASTPEIEIVTYDDILKFANRRRMIINPGANNKKSSNKSLNRMPKGTN